MAEYIYKTVALIILASIFGAFIYMVFKIQSDQAKIAKKEQDLKDEIIKSEVENSSLSDLVDANNKSRGKS